MAGSLKAASPKMGRLIRAGPVPNVYAKQDARHVNTWGGPRRRLARLQDGFDVAAVSMNCRASGTKTAQRALCPGNDAKSC
jgi:hypothetical protein